MEAAAPKRPRLDPKQYHKAEQIGRGQFADVFKFVRQDEPAQSTPSALPKEVAVKQLSQTALTEKEQERLRDEVKVLGKLRRHENIVQLFHVCKDRLGRTRFYMELCQEDLRSYAKDRTFDSDELTDMIGQIATGLQEIHAQRIVHRDLKPQNILVVFIDGRAVFKIADFGLVFLFVEGDPSSQVSMSAAGTRDFMAPEMLLAFMSSESYDDKPIIRGQPYKVDIFSLGIVIYCLHCKKKPFSLNELISPEFDATDVLERNVTSPKLKDLLGGMLQLTPTLRPDIATVLAKVIYINVDINIVQLIVLLFPDRVPLPQINHTLQEQRDRLHPLQQ